MAQDWQATVSRKPSPPISSNHQPRLAAFLSTLEQFSSMLLGDSEVVAKLQNNPETLSDEELARTSLSVFSKSLGVFNSRTVINAYLRWLEIQRAAPRRNISYHWFNTIAQWTQALRARGFSLEEINREVAAWKELNGPFAEPDPSEPESRLPPNSANLAFGWDRIPRTTKIVLNNQGSLGSTLPAMSWTSHSQLERKLDGALITVPASYICNRCKGRGHYVSDCPTNEDPEYDISAGFDYICKYCGEQGTHYFLFCPRNPDPNSIYKRRQGRAFHNLQDSHFYGNLGQNMSSPSSQGPSESPRQAAPSRSNIVVPKLSNPTADFDLFTKRRRASLRGATAEGFEALRSSEGDMVWERLENDIQGGQSMGLQNKSNAFTTQTVIERTAPESIVTITNPSPHVEFLNKLFAQKPSQPNPMWRLRMTALEMWDINDEKKRRRDYEERGNLNGMELSTELNTPSYNQKNLIYYYDGGREDIVDVDDEGYSVASEYGVDQIDILIDTKGCREEENYQEEQENAEFLTREERVRAIQKKVNSIEGLRTRIVSGEDVESPETEQLANRGFPQGTLNVISRRIRAAESQSPSSCTSSSPELSSPPRTSSSGTKRGSFCFRTM